MCMYECMHVGGGGGGGGGICMGEAQKLDQTIYCVMFLLFFFLFSYEN